VNVLRVEEAIETHYATIRFTPQFIADVRAQVAEAPADEEAATRLLHRQLDLAAKTDDSVPQAKAKIAANLRDIEAQRQRLTERLGETSDKLATSARLIEVCLRLLENLQELYRRCDDEQRRLLNQALFTAIYIDHDEVSGHDLKEPFAQLHAAQTCRHRKLNDKPDPGMSDHQDASRAASRSGDGPTASSGVEALLAGIDLVPVSSKTSSVELRGIEPLTFSMRTRRATNCATAPWCSGSISAWLAASGHPLRSYSPTARR
jgi:site-specific DNA recombinase